MTAYDGRNETREILRSQVEIGKKIFFFNARIFPFANISIDFVRTLNRLYVCYYKTQTLEYCFTMRPTCVSRGKKNFVQRTHVNNTLIRSIDRLLSFAVVSAYSLEKKKKFF